LIEHLIVVLNDKSPIPAATRQWPLAIWGMQEPLSLIFFAPADENSE
jgi:hypothetical protein